MFLLLFIEASDALNRHVVGLSRARCEDDVFRVSADEVGHVLRTQMLMAVNTNTGARAAKY